MKNENNIWVLIIYLLIGALFSYAFCQHSLLIIDPKVNVVTSLISISTAAIGLYLAISLKKIQNKSSNLHSYLQPKLDLVWNLFLNLSHKLSLNDQIELTELNKSIKEITQDIVPLKKMFESFGIQDLCIDKLETKIENLEQFLVDSCDIKDNIINFHAYKAELRTQLDETHALFVECLKTINTIS